MNEVLKQLGVTGLLDNLQAHAVQFAITLVSAVIIYFVGKWLAKFISHLVEIAVLKSKVDQTLAHFIRDIVYYVILLFVAIAVLNKVGIETNSLVALVGAAGIAVGFALQGSLANFAAGVMIIFFQPFKVGDSIESVGAKGIVAEIQIFNTVLNGAGGERIILPNSKVTADKIVVSKTK